MWDKNHYWSLLGKIKCSCSNFIEYLKDLLWLVENAMGLKEYAIVKMESNHQCQPHLHINNCCNPHTMQTDKNLPMESHDINQYFDAKSLLSHNDSLIASRLHHTSLERSGPNMDISGHGLPPLRVASDMLNEPSQDTAGRSMQSCGHHGHSLHPSLLCGASRPHFATASATASTLGPAAWGDTDPHQASI